jgi:hypothetical protein
MFFGRSKAKNSQTAPSTEYKTSNREKVNNSLARVSKTDRPLTKQEETNRKKAVNNGFEERKKEREARINAILGKCHDHQREYKSGS